MKRLFMANLSFGALCLALGASWLIVGFFLTGFRLWPDPVVKKERDDFKRGVEEVYTASSQTLANIDPAQLKAALGISVEPAATYSERMAAAVSKVQEVQKEIWDSDLEKSHAELEKLRASPFFARRSSENGVLAQMQWTVTLKTFSKALELTKVSHGDPQKEVQSLCSELSRLRESLDLAEETNCSVLIVLPIPLAGLTMLWIAMSSKDSFIDW
jgi:hypothetical protein